MARLDLQTKMNFKYEDGGIVFDEHLQEEFDAWIEDGNVIKMEDGYATQDAQYRNRLKDIDALKEYFYKEFIKGQYDTYADGGSLDDKHLVAKAIEYITGSGVDEESIQIQEKEIGFKYRTSKTPTTISKKLIEDTIRMHRKSLESRGRYNKGGVSEFKKGGNVSSLEKRVAEVNALIKEGNEKGVEVIDKTTTWEAPMKYNPIKYTNGVLYISYKELDLYKNNKGMGREWKNESYKIGKHEMGENSFRGSAQTDALSHIARMYRSAINQFNKYGYADGGESMENRAKKQARKDIKTHLFRPQAPYQSIDKPSEEWERYELPYDTKMQYDFEPNSFSAQDKRYFEYAKGGEAGFDDAGTSMVLYHEKQGNFIVPKGQVYLWLYDVEDSRGKLQSSEYDYVFYPYASTSMAWQSGFIPPLKRIWTKKFQKDHKGSEHLLGVIKAYLIDKENGEKELFVDMMSVNPNSKKKGIMSYMIKDLRETFKLTKEQVKFSDLTDEGKKFVEKSKFEKGGYVGSKVRTKNLRGGYNNYVITGYDERYKRYNLKDLEKDLTTTATIKELKNEYEFVDKFADGGLTRGEIEDKIEGLRLRIAKTKKQISGYEITQRGKYNKLFQEKVVPLQKELDTLSDLWGKSKYARGGFMYEVQKKGSPSNDMRETMFTAKNLTELKKKIIEKYGTSEGFMVRRRTEQGYFVPVKFEDGGESEILTMPRPVITPAPTKTPAPAKPNKNNPYKPKVTPKPKMSKYDYIWLIK